MNLDLFSVKAVDDFGGLQSPFQRAGMDAVQRAVFERQGQFPGLVDAGFAQFDIRDALNALLFVPEGFAVANQCQLHIPRSQNVRECRCRGRVDAP